MAVPDFRPDSPPTWWGPASVKPPFLASKGANQNPDPISKPIRENPVGLQLVTSKLLPTERDSICGTPAPQEIPRPTLQKLFTDPDGLNPLARLLRCFWGQV
jgi:hypothetical protein